MFALSDNFRNNDVRAFVETSVDLSTMRPDHRLVLATSPWLKKKGASGMIGGSVDMIEMRCNLLRRVQGLEQCCSMLPVLIGMWTLIHIWQCRMPTSYTLLNSVLRNNARRRKKFGFLITRWNLFGGSALPCECGQNFDVSGVGVLCRESLWCGEM